MSPEQVSGAPVDGRSDIFSLGVVLYELLTNRKPFQGDNLTAISYKIVHEDFTPPAELSSDIPPEFNPIVARAMAKDPWNRYQRGKDLALALYQLKAHMEEQKALQDLGTMVSAAENLPTLKLANLQELAAQGAPQERDTAVTPMAGSPPSPPPAMPPPPPPPLASATPTPNPAGARGPRSRVGHDPELTAAITNIPAECRGRSLSRVRSKTRSSCRRCRPSSRLRLGRPSGGLRARRNGRRSPRPRSIRSGSGASSCGVGALVLVIIGLFALFARSASKPSVTPDAALEQGVRETKQALEEGQEALRRRASTSRASRNSARSSRAAPTTWRPGSTRRWRRTPSRASRTSRRGRSRSRRLPRPREPRWTRAVSTKPRRRRRRRWHSIRPTLRLRAF